MELRQDLIDELSKPMETWPLGELTVTIEGSSWEVTSVRIIGSDEFYGISIQLKGEGDQKMRMYFNQGDGKHQTRNGHIFHGVGEREDVAYPDSGLGMRMNSALRLFDAQFEGRFIEDDGIERSTSGPETYHIRAQQMLDIIEAARAYQAAQN